MSVLAFQAVTKVFKSSLRGRYQYTLGPISFGVEPGEIFGYLGPNGAGKTTTIKLAMGLLRPSAGKILCFGAPCESAEAKQRVGFLPEQPYFYQHLTARELLEFYGDLFGMSRNDSRRKAEDLLGRVGLADQVNTPVSKLSKGMLQRIGLAQALVNDPDLVVLDEPLSGLDPVGRRDIRDLILDLRSRGKTVFFSSHILQDVEMICDRVAILAGGTITRIASVAEVLERSVRWTEVQVDGLGVAAAKALGFGDVVALGDKAVINVAREEELTEALGKLIAAGAKISAVVPMRLTLEDYFMSHVGNSANPGKGSTPPASGSTDPVGRGAEVAGPGRPNRRPHGDEQPRSMERFPTSVGREVR
ncbi:MAG: ABC transporter ATP-binding protein [bacterium]